MSFHINQKVVCITDKWIMVGMNNKPCPDRSRPHKDQIYTIRVLFRGHGGYLFFHLAEIDAVPDDEQFIFVDVAFDARGFRPLIEKKLPAELTALLDIKNHKPLPEHHQPKRQRVSHDLCGND